MTSQEKNELLQLIGAGNVQKAINDLLSIELNESHKKEAIAISSRFQKLKKQDRNGIVSFEQSTITENQITTHLIDLINYPEGQRFPKENSINVTNPSQPIIWKYITMAAVIIGILGSLAEVLNVINILPNKTNEKLQLTVFVTDIKGNVILENIGRLNIPLGNRSLNEIIGANGRTNFPDITAENIGDTILIGLDAEGWEIVNGKNTFVFIGKSIHLKVKKDDSLGMIKGVVTSRGNRQPIEDAKVLINADTIIFTDVNGIFKIVLPEKMRIKKTTDDYRLTVSKEGYVTIDRYHNPKSSDADIRLEKN